MISPEWSAVIHDWGGVGWNGTTRNGPITAAPAKMAGQHVKKRHKLGCWWLAVRHDGRVVAEITRAEGARTWYAETA